MFGGIGDLRHPWQVFSSAFEHGWPGFPPIIHLALNLLLMFSVAVTVERLLGSARFLALTLLSILFYWVARWLLFPLQANGSSVFIWSYAPVLLVAVLETRRAGGPFGEAYRQATHLLFIMWAVVSGAMGVFLMLSGLSPWSALACGNAFHFSATLAGFVGAALWNRHIRLRVRRQEYRQSGLDRAATWAATAIPIGFAMILALVALDRV